ncbi:plasmid pRiA4b ORF-3 family protein [Candidatus Albibeggiatoa sp. nov. NOAA]|uniref:plasmid pRiA4b ORF-3 family protein n=1 Tax=Candidatus Albibeggiatoa sp. nov. NOAA TaxID=3162724 RepID=UPI0032F92AE9|nr:plasmid pRiA4b ORF-3 family protein [Thiotrichaceae bacterium]
MSTQFLQLKISLKGAKPPIWRRVVVPDALTLFELHQVVIASMGWGGHHLHQFESGGVFYGNPEDDLFGDGDIKEEKQYTLSELLTQEKDKINYQYDFGDSWEHQIILEKILPTVEQHPVCIKGKRACPPDDVGGIWGYGEFLDILAHPEHADYNDTLDWIGGDFNSELFDLNKANEALAQLQFFKA